MNKILSTITLITIMFVLSTKKVSASTLDTVQASGNQRAVQIYSSTSAMSKNPIYGPEYAIRNLTLLYINEPEATQIVIDAYAANGMKPEYRKIIEDAGIPIHDTPTAEKKSEPTQTAFTVEDITPYPAWTTKTCNIRSGADTTYDKVGSLEKFEQVTVTGNASTGWFRINTSDGKEAYIASSLIITEDSNKVTFQTEEGNGTVVTTTVEGDNAEAVAKVVEEIQAETPHENEAEVSQESDEEEVSSQGIEAEAPHEHLYGEWEITKKATLISTGEKIKKCTVCGEIMETEVIPAKTGLLIVLIISIVAVLCGGIAIAFAHKKKVLISKNA